MYDINDFYLSKIDSFPKLNVPLCIPNESPSIKSDLVIMKRGAKRIIALFLATITTAVCFHNYLHLPPVIGMLTGLAYLQFFGYYLKKTAYRDNKSAADNVARDGEIGSPVPFDVFSPVAKAEWDTLFFFYGVVLCVGGLGGTCRAGPVSSGPPGAQ